MNKTVIIILVVIGILAIVYGVYTWGVKNDKWGPCSKRPASNDPNHPCNINKIAA